MHSAQYLLDEKILTECVLDHMTKFGPKLLYQYKILIFVINCYRQN